MPELTSVLTDAEILRKKVHQKVTDALSGVFPLDLKGRTLEAHDIQVHERDFSSDEQKRALLSGSTLQSPVKATLVLKDGGGKVIDTAKDFTLVHIPYLTSRHTVISDGNEYQFANQIRRKPGVYTQRASNDELHTVFNLGRGKNFDVGFDPKKGTFALQYGTSNIPLYPVLRGLGVTHEHIAHYLGEGVAKENQQAHGHQVEAAIGKLYQKLEHPAVYNAKALPTAKVEAIKKRYEMSLLDPDVTTHTLGKGYDKVTPEAILSAAKKILAVHAGKAVVDDTDSLNFKTFHSVDDFLAERLKLTARMWVPKARLALQGKASIREALRPAPFSDSIRKFVTTSTLTAVPSGINPLELMDHAVKVTALGEGGITSDRAIPFSTRLSHATHFGALDPFRTVESFHAGVDIRASIVAHRDDKGNLYTALHDVKSGKQVFVRAGDLGSHVVAFANQPLKGQVHAFVNGEVQKVGAGRVTHQMMHTSHQFSPATSLLPFIHNIQGNRAIMGSKYGTQALPLLEREVPFIQVKSHLPGERSFESIYGHMTVPTAPVAGVVKKIEDGYVWIQPHKEKKAADRSVTHTREMGPFTFNIEIPKGATKVKGKEIKPNPVDYGHLPGYRGPDGDSLDFFVGTDPEGELVCYEKQKRSSDEKPWKTTDVKFVVGLTEAEVEGLDQYLKDTTNEKVRYTGLVEFKDWNELKAYIDEHYKVFEEKTAASPALVKVPFQTNFPFPSKTYLNHNITVKPGDKVEEGQRLGDSNYTRDGVMALGKNLLVGYLPYYGVNSNDAVVISEACSKRLTSEHMYREVFPLDSRIELSKSRHQVYYGNKVTPQQYAKLDDSGVIKVGSRVDVKDPLVLGLTKNVIQGVDAMLGRISKSLTKPFREVVLSWEHGAQGEVVEVFRNASQIAILIRTQEKMQVGDKLAGRYGNKGVVARVIPDHEMIQDARGRPIDLLMTSAGVVSRINPGQILETALGKVVEKTGKPILYDNGEPKNAVKWVREQLSKHGLQDKEVAYDPVAKRHLNGPDGKGVMIGRQYIYKLFKSTDTNFSGHGVGPYDVNEQPLKTGGDDSAKGVGKMEFDALLAHNARSYLHEAVSVKGQKNDEFWKAIQTGMPLPAAKPSFAFNKFVAMLEGAGIRVDKRGSKIKLLPITDKGVTARSAGAIENKKTLIAKNLKPEAGGLFDPMKTGGPQGTLYSHIDLHEAIPHPVFVEPVRRLLGLTQKEFDQHMEERGGKWFHEQLGKIDVGHQLTALRAQMVKEKGAELDNVVKKIKYLSALKQENLTPQEAYMMRKVPVIPPIFRPILPEKRDPSQLMIADANKLYAHLMDTNDVLKNTALESDRGKHRSMVFHAVGAVFGTHDPLDEKLVKQDVKGFLTNIAGSGSPKGGFFQRKLMRHTQDVSGRGTAVPDVNLGMDQVGLPEQMLWQMFDKMIVARLVRQGYPALQAREMVDKKAPAAREAMLAETRDRPVLVNRAPTLHRWNITAAYPVPVQGKTIRVSPFIEKGQNLDYDGDTLQIHVPIQPGAVADAKRMLMSEMLLSDQSRNRLLAFPQHEAVMGVTWAAKAKSSGQDHHFHTREEALAAWRAGKLQLTDTVSVDQMKKASEEEPVDPGILTTEEALFYWPAEHITGHEDSPV